MASVKRKPTPGISRIDQPERHNRGFFVRVQRRGKIHSSFFTDKKHGGRAKALAAGKMGFARTDKMAADSALRQKWQIGSSLYQWNVGYLREFIRRSPSP